MTPERLAEIRAKAELATQNGFALRAMIAAFDESRAETDALRARVKRLREALGKVSKASGHGSVSACRFHADEALAQDDAAEAG